MHNTAHLPQPTKTLPSPHLELPYEDYKISCLRKTVIYLFGYNLGPKSPDPQRLNSVHRRQVVATQSFSHVRLFVTPWTAACQASLSFTVSQSLFKLMSNKSVMPSNHLLLCRPHFFFPSIFLSNRVFPSELAFRIRWPKYNALPPPNVHVPEPVHMFAKGLGGTWWLGISKWEHNPGLSAWAWCNHKVLIREKERTVNVSDRMWERLDWPLLALKTERGHELRNAGKF